jgi:hypothetical protein
MANLHGPKYAINNLALITPLPCFHDFLGAHRVVLCHRGHGDGVEARRGGGPSRQPAAPQPVIDSCDRTAWPLGRSIGCPCVSVSVGVIERSRLLWPEREAPWFAPAWLWAEG